MSKRDVYKISCCIFRYSEAWNYNGQTELGIERQQFCWLMGVCLSKDVSAAGN